MFFWQRIHIINELEHYGVTVKTFNPLTFTSMEEANEQFVKEMTESKYDLLLSSTCYEKMIFESTLEAARRIGLPSMCIRWDNLIVPYSDKHLASQFDLIWLTSHETEYLYKKWGANTIFLPYAANPFSFVYCQTELLKKACFIGTPYGSRSIMINSLTRNNIDVDVFCGKNVTSNSEFLPRIDIKTEYVHLPSYMLQFNNFRFKQGRKLLLGKLANKLRGSIKIEDNVHLTRFPSCMFEEISNNYSKYSLCLSSTSTHHTDALKNPLKVINLRAFEIPMSGGITICKYNEELAQYFEDKKEIIFYDTNEDLIEKASYYINNASDVSLYRMKQAARKRAEGEHTWWNRFNKAFELLGINV